MDRILPLSAMVGRLCAMVSIVIPGYLILVMSGPKRALEVLPAIVACGVSFAGMQFYVSNYMGPELTDIASSLTCIAVMVLVLKFWKPKQIMRLEGDVAVPAGEVDRARVRVEPPVRPAADAHRGEPLAGREPEP